jgi:hypothetical protein
MENAQMELATHTGNEKVGHVISTDKRSAPQATGRRVFQALK